MRLERLRTGLLADPVTPGATTDLRPVVDPNPVGRSIVAAPTNKTIGDLGFRSEMQQFTQHERDPKWDAIRSELGLGPATPHPQVTPSMVAQARLGEAIRGSGGQPQMPPTNPRMRGVLPELSDLAQGKAMGRPMTPADIAPPAPPPPIPGGDLPGGDDADLPSRPPLQDMQPADPSYGDLFKKLRPYQ